MLAWQEQLLSSVDDESLSLAMVFDRIRTVGSSLGFDYVCYGIRIPMPMGRPQVLILENYPKGWMQRYGREGYVDVDPTVAHGSCSQAPILWNQTHEAAPEFWEDAAGHGLKHGWAQSTLDGTGTAGLLTLSRGGTEGIGENELKQNLVQMRWLGSVAHLALLRRMRTELPVTQGINLTGREIEVLKWSAAGKTYCEIGAILNIANDTVKFHLKNACRKLECYNKTQAVAHAAMLGLLS